MTLLNLRHPLGLQGEVYALQWFKAHTITLPKTRNIIMLPKICFLVKRMLRTPFRYNITRPTVLHCMHTVTRFDFSSSDAMSIGGCTSANSSGVSNRLSDSTHSPTTDLAVTRSASAASGTMAKSTGCEDDCGPVSEGSGCDHTCAGKKDTSVPVESLRWEHQCSDEEEERQRIEVYKENRRKRYENALEQRKAQLSLHTTNKVKYYI